MVQRLCHSWVKNFQKIPISCMLLMISSNILLDQVCSAETSPSYSKFGKLVGSVEGDLITNGQWLRAQSGDPRRSQSLSPVWGARLALDQAINHYIWIGGELALTWLSEPVLLEWRDGEARVEHRGGKRLIATPSARLRLDFPLACRWFLEGIFVGGVTGM